MQQGKNVSRSVVESNWTRLLVPDVLGFYKRCEVTEILGFDSNNPNQPFNVFSVLVLEEADPVDVKKLLNEKRIKISGLRNLYFGVWQYHIDLKTLENTIEQYANNGRWAIEDSEISFGDLHALPPYFVPPDGTECVPINKLLKNNFWNGSYVMELFDNSKLSISPLLKNPLQLQTLSEIIQGYAPIKIASLYVVLQECNAASHKTPGAVQSCAHDSQQHDRHARPLTRQDKHAHSPRGARILSARCNGCAA